LAKLTIVFGVLLVLLGVGGYFGTGSQSYTALIPAIPGLLFIILGALAVAKPSWHKHLMHAAAALALLGFFGTIGGFVKYLQWFGGTEPERPAAVRAMAIMCVLMVVFVVLCVRSFIAARKARQAGLPA